MNSCSAGLLGRLQAEHALLYAGAKGKVATAIGMKLVLFHFV